MAKRGKAMFKAEVELQVPGNLVAMVLQRVNLALDDAAMALAAEVKERAKGSTAFQDYKGTSRENAYSKRRWSKESNPRHLRKSIRHKTSKFEGGGAIVYSDAPHAHLVEFGHVLVDNRKSSPTYGKIIGTVPEHPFLRPARNAVLGEAQAVFARMIARELDKE